MDNGASSYRRFLDGDQAAFDGVMNELFYSTVFFANRYVNDLSAAEDIAMEAFSDLIVHKSRYNFKVTLKTYVFMLARSRALDFLRRRKAMQLTELSDAYAEADDLPSLEDSLLADERRRAVNSAIESLPNDMRIAVHLVYFEDMSYGETARIMGKSKKQVDNLLYRAKGKLRIILGEDGEQLL